ncbi:MAG: PilW family protein [Burkholderiales bacterium]
MSLTEILVGVLIGLIGMVVIFQVLATAEQRKRTTAAGSDAQIAGAIALFMMERDLRLAGYGFGTSSFMGCTVNAYDAARPGGNFTYLLAPVRITQGAGGTPDTVSTLWGNSALFVATQTFSASTATTKRTQGRGGLLPGDLVIAAGAGPVCAMVEITGNANADGATIDHATGSYTNAAGASVVARFNPAGGPLVVFTQGNLYNLGSDPRLDVWSIRNNKLLTVSNGLRYTDANSDGVNDWSEVADGIIDLQAEYGVDANNDNRISDGEWTTADPADWSKVRAIRIALLARSSQYEKEQVTTAAPTWVGNTTAGVNTFTMRNVDGTADTNPSGPNNWRNYRYRVYQAVIPLRNMIWGTAP